MRLLLIEDDDVLRTTLKSDLERAGFAVDCAVDGETGEFLGSTEHYDVGAASPPQDFEAVHARQAKVERGLDEEHQSAIIGVARTEVLTAQEFRLLRCFRHHAGEVLSKAFLAEHVYGLDADPGSNVIEVYVNRLRHKLGKDLIQTRRGQGYVFDGAP